MPKLRSHIGDPVKFGAPLSARMLGAQQRFGRIVDEVWALDSQRDPQKHDHDDPNCGGNYAFCSQLIDWEEGGYSIRLAYYRLQCKGTFWQFAGQTSIETKPSTIKLLLEKTLAKAEWFKKPDRQTD